MTVWSLSVICGNDNTNNSVGSQLEVLLLVEQCLDDTGLGKTIEILRWVIVEFDLTVSSDEPVRRRTV